MLSLTGHLNPSFKIARGLKEKGHRVCYVSLPDWEDLSHSFLDHIRSLGFEAKAIVTHAHEEYVAHGTAFHAFVPAIETELGTFVEEFKPDLFVVDALLPYVALMSYGLRIPTAQLSVVLPRQHRARIPPLNGTIVPRDGWLSRLRIELSWQRNNGRRIYDAFRCRLAGKKHLDHITRETARRVNYPRKKILFNSVFAPALEMPQLFACPQAFDFPFSKTNSRHHYIDASVAAESDQKGTDVPFPWERIDAGKPLIFCTLGSESSYYKHSKRFFQTIIDAMAGRPDWQVVIAVSKRIDTAEFNGVTPNIVLVNWAPHLAVLKRAALMINHGGLGTVKECILSGVPIIAYPSTADQPGNAARIVYHQLGMMGDIAKVTPEEICSRVETVLNNSSYKKQTELMAHKFRKMECAENAVEVLEGLLKSEKNPKAQY